MSKKSSYLKGVDARVPRNTERLCCCFCFVLAIVALEAFDWSALWPNTALQLWRGGGSGSGGARFPSSLAALRSSYSSVDALLTEEDFKEDTLGLPTYDEVI